MKKLETRQYQVGATFQGEQVVFKVEATSGTKAVHEARRLARTQGMRFISVQYVKPKERTIVRYGMDYAPPLIALGGTCQFAGTEEIHAGETHKVEETTLSVGEINDHIGNVWNQMVVFSPRPEEPPLKAYEQDGHIFLDDGVSGRQELLMRTPMELIMMLYDWATYTGYCSDDFDVFVENCWG